MREATQVGNFSEQVWVLSGERHQSSYFGCRKSRRVMTVVGNQWVCCIVKSRKISRSAASLGRVCLRLGSGLSPICQPRCTMQRLEVPMDGVLFVNDSGFVPAGRFLEDVAVVAGEFGLVTVNSYLDETDVGKRVAIPGAADLVATIGLAGEVRAQSDMDPGLTTLTATFIQGLPGNRDHFGPADKGKLVTVAGAGPNGDPLVARVQSVDGPATLTLTAAASVQVSAAETVLNDPLKVILDDYARSSAEAVTVDLGDRSITDAHITVGASELYSAAAVFSPGDRGKVVTVRAAGRHVTTVASVQTPTRLTLTAPAGRGVQGGVADVWQEDDQNSATGSSSDFAPVLRHLLAGLGDAHLDRHEIRFGPGVYDFTCSEPHVPAALMLQDLANLTIRGSGTASTILRLRPDQQLNGGDAHVMQVLRCKNIELVDFAVHGAYLSMGAVNEQMHGIKINGGSKDVTVHNVRVYQTAGDGIRLLGADKEDQTKITRRVLIDRCSLVQNKRTGVAFQRGVETVRLTNSYFEMSPPGSDACIDFEPTGTTVGGGPARAPKDVLINANLMLHGNDAIAVSLSGTSAAGGADPLTDVHFSNNTLVGGSVFCTDVDRMTFRGNIVVGSTADTARTAVDIHRGGRHLLISDNLLINMAAGVEAVIKLGGASHRPTSRTVVADNVCVTASGVGVLVMSPIDVTVHDNLIIATGVCIDGISVRADAADGDGISLRDNDITTEDNGAWLAGVRISATLPQRLGNLSVMGNSIRGSNTGISFDANGVTHAPICALNHIGADVTQPIRGVETLKGHALIVGGAGTGSGAVGRGTGRFLVGTGDPNVADGNTGIVGNVGDIYQRLDGSAGHTLYVKEGQDGAADGWTPK